MEFGPENSNTPDEEATGSEGASLSSLDIPTGQTRNNITEHTNVSEQVELIRKAMEGIIDREPSGAYRTYALVKQTIDTPNGSLTRHGVRIDLFAFASDSFPSESVEIDVSLGIKFLKSRGRSVPKQR
ncbi:MAG: hypothetical protein GYA55_13220 [SAR324 cluster bacterium]|uniref:Uncharacterized protein n=1 Tax=SAR324 cluster bacterium TaxID=2024889 RepID=A0A7X9FTP1_9DELT|nr:hypothetical protein [SAR324 cluster bacterium]